jgi:outer membrane protein W
MLNRASTGTHGVTIRRLVAVAAAAVLCLAAGSAAAQSGKGEYVGQWSVAGKIGIAIPNTDDYSNVAVWGLALGYRPVPWFEVALETGRFATTVEQPEPDGIPNHDIASGRLEVIPLCLDLQFSAPLAESMATAFFTVGGGYYLVDYTMADEPQAVFAAGGAAGLPDQFVHDAWGAHAGVGLEYVLASWLSFTVEGRYLLLAPKVSGTARDDYQLGGSLNLNTWLFTGGIKVAF